MRSSSSRQFWPRSQAIIFTHTSESTAVHGSGAVRRIQNSGGSTGPVARNAFTPAA
jgi:hypothetical protein